MNALPQIALTSLAVLLGSPVAARAQKQGAPASPPVEAKMPAGGGAASNVSAEGGARAEARAHGGGPGEAAGRGSTVVGREPSRLGSGTSWEPESSPLWAAHSRWGKWTLTQHGNLMAMYDSLGGPRGVSRPLANNWYLAMGTLPREKGELMVRTMLSLEPATVGRNGQPQLFQAGEGLINRQHPNDLFMEIAAQYTRSLNRSLAGYLYLAPVGEPALGPVAFVHRASALDIPAPPLAHHWTDSTHISVGVLTAGLQSRRWKGEVSWFNGHEPDVNRWDIDALGLNSVSGRLSFAPTPNWTFQVSRGHIDRPELRFAPEQGSLDRTTASAQYHRPLPRGYWSTTFVWGRNEGEGRGVGSGTADAFLLESCYNWADRNYVFGRVERVAKDDLFEEPDPRAERKFLVNAVTLGFSRDIGHSKSFETALGAMATVYAKPGSLDRAYGEFPVSFQVFLRIRPRRVQE